MKILATEDTNFHLDTINIVQRSAVRDLEVMLTNLWIRVIHDNCDMKPTVPLRQSAELAQIAVFDGSSSFSGFPDVAAADAWLRSEALVMLKRRSGDFVVARPVHERATRVRNTKEALDSGTSKVLYGWLRSYGEDVLVKLRDYLSVSLEDADQDLTTHALGILGESLGRDVKNSAPREPESPLCSRLGMNYCEDMERLLAYRTVMPRLALIEHMARLSGLYVGLYLLTTFKHVTILDRAGGAERCEACIAGPTQDCRPKPEIFVDCTERPGTSTSRLAEDSWREVEDTLLSYLESHIRLKKFHEFAERNNQNEFRDHVPIGNLEELARSAADTRHAANLEDWALDRLNAIENRSSGEDLNRFREIRSYYQELGSGFDAYTSIISQTWLGRWHNYYLQVLDYVFAGRKNAGGLIRQPEGGRRRTRRAVLGPHIVETLALVLLLRNDEGKWHPEPMRVDELVHGIGSRYGLLVDRLPGGTSADPVTAGAIDTNLQSFKLRLREAGLFRDMSDAYLAQTVTPRYFDLRGPND